jgi:hypothetical protein
MRPGDTPLPKHKKFILLVIIIAVIAVLFVVIKHKKSPTASSSPSNAAPAATTAAINGLLVDPTVAKRRPIAIIIENHPDARPQAGLSQADIIYETLAEGGITRYMALFQTTEVNNIGPIRSARVYFAELADGWRTALVHVGGNSDALTNIRQGVYKNISDADQFFNEPYFHRISSRPAPHNVYASTAKIGSLIHDHHYSDQANYPAWKFKSDTPISPPTASKITIPFSTPSYTVGYRYNPSDNSYNRYVAGTADRDANNNHQINARDIVVQFADDYATQTDTIGSISFKLSAGGKALIFMDGGIIMGSWKRDNGFTRYFDPSGNEIAFNRGQIWIEIVPSALEKAVTRTAS